MNYELTKDVIGLIEEFENENVLNNFYSSDLDGFKQWMVKSFGNTVQLKQCNWVSKEKGRGADSVINTLIVHMNRYAKAYSKSAIFDSEFTSQDDFIYLINLNAFGAMSKMELIRKNVHEKPIGMQIINRLINLGWVDQHNSEFDKRTKVISINTKGIIALDNQMDKIRQATQVVTGNLTEVEKITLIELLTKLDEFHQEIYDENLSSENLLEKALFIKNKQQ